MEFDIRDYNRKAWNRQVEEGNEWTKPVSHEEIELARRGEWKIVLTPLRPVPQDWFPPTRGLRVLCLASGGGQQGPVLAAAGAQVTVFDNSPKQLAQDKRVAEREGLEIRTVEGDMRDLSAFDNGSFDLIVHPVSNVFIPNLRPLWSECARVLQPGGLLLAGYMNPLLYLFDRDLMDEQGILQVKYTLPYSDLDEQASEELKRAIKNGWPVEFSHSLEEQIGGMTEAGFAITGLYEDKDPRGPLFNYTPVYIATRAVRDNPAR
jgi:SAM-dependent methyltransferase